MAALGVQGWCRGLCAGGTGWAARAGWLWPGMRCVGVLVLSGAACEQGGFNQHGSGSGELVFRHS